MTVSNLSCCGIHVPLPPSVQNIIKAKWLDVALALSMVALLIVGILATMGVLQGVGISGPYGGAGGLILLMLLKTALRCLMTDATFKKPEARAEHTSNGTADESSTKNTSKTVVQLKDEKTGTSIDMVLHKTKMSVVNGKIQCCCQLESVPTKGQMRLETELTLDLNPHEAYALSQTSGNDCTLSSTIELVASYFELLDKTDWTAPSVEDIFGKYTDASAECVADKIMVKFATETGGSVDLLLKTIHMNPCKVKDKVSCLFIFERESFELYLDPYEAYALSQMPDCYMVLTIFEYFELLDKKDWPPVPTIQGIFEKYQFDLEIS